MVRRHTSSVFTLAVEKPGLSNSYTMGCPPVDLANHEIFHVKVGEGGINADSSRYSLHI